MSKAYAAILAYLVFFYMFSRINVYICLLYHRSGSDDYIEVEVKMLGGFVLYKIRVPVIQFTSQDMLWFMSEVSTENESTPTYPKREQRFVRRIIRFYLKHPKRLKAVFRAVRHYHILYRTYMGRIARGTTCELFCWKTKVGSEDAAVAAIGAGFAWAIKELILVHIGRKVQFKTRPRVDVTPIYGAWRFETELRCIFRVRLGHVISATTRLLNTNRREAVNRV